MSLGIKLPSVDAYRKGDQKAGVQRDFYFVGQCQLLVNGNLEYCIKEYLKSSLGRSVRPERAILVGDGTGTGVRKAFVILPSLL